jgi:CRISPR-associated protein Csm4
MSSYKISWKPKGPLITPLHSDTIFGHLCWAYRYSYGEEALEKLLARGAAEDILVSSAFPAGMLPVPCVPEKQGEMETALALFKQNHPQKADIKLKCKEAEYTAKKALRKRSLMSWEQWQRVRHCFSRGALYEQWLPVDDESPISQTATLFRNRVNRLTCITGDNSLFSRSAQFFDADMKFESYLTTELWSEQQVQELFDAIAHSGFGKNKSIGRGSFSIQVQSWQPSEVAGANAHLVLSNTIPASTDSTHAYFTGRVKHARVGGVYALSTTPRKFPFYHMQPGSVFAGPRPPQGTWLTGVHPANHKIVQNLRCFSIPFVWEARHE